MVGRLDSTQKMVNQEARLTTGAFRTTNHGALSLESGIRPAAAQLDNRLRRFALRLASLPKGDQERDLIGASDCALGQRLQSALGCWNGREETVLLEVASPLEEEAAAALEAKRPHRPGLTMSTDGSRPENGATGYAVTWKKGMVWKGHKTHMGWHQEAFDAECAALARALQVAAARTHTVGTVTIFTDAQVAIWRMTSDDPGPGQQYALEARRHIASLRTKEPNVKIDIRWCPSHQGIEGNKIADEWAKLAADEPDAHGVEWFSTTTRTGRPARGNSPCHDRMPTSSVAFRAEADRHPELGHKAARPHQEPEVPPQHEAETGPDGSQDDQAPRLALLSDEVGTLLDRAVPGMDDSPTDRHLLVVPV